MSHTASKQKYVYAIVRNRDTRMLLEDGKLPIYWSMKIAKERCSLFKGFRVVRLQMEIIQEMLYAATPITPLRTNKS